MSWPQVGRCGCQPLVGRKGTCTKHCPYSWATRNDQTSSLRWKPLPVQFESGQQLDTTIRISCVANLREAGFQCYHREWPWNKEGTLLGTSFLAPTWHRAGPQQVEHHNVCLNLRCIHCSRRSPLILVRSESTSLSEEWPQIQETIKCNSNGETVFKVLIENQSNRFRIFVSQRRVCGPRFSCFLPNGDEAF